MSEDESQEISKAQHTCVAAQAIGHMAVLDLSCLCLVINESNSLFFG